MKINASSTAVQNYFNQQNNPVKEEKAGDFQKVHEDEINLGKLNHFKIESPFKSDTEPKTLTEAEETSLNLLFPGRNKQFNRHYMETIKNHTAGTFLDVKG